jgi:hypothetical protein
MQIIFYTQSFNRCSNKSFQGPLNLDIISLIVGSLLSISYLEKIEGVGTRIVFIKYGNNVEYLIKAHFMLSQSGYCNPQRPKLYKLIGTGNKVFFLINFKTYRFTSFNWIFDLFYTSSGKSTNNVKFIPEQNFFNLLTPLTLATIFISSIWAEEKPIKTLYTRSPFINACLPVVKLQQLVDISQALKLMYNIETDINNKSGPRAVGYGSLLIKDSSKAVFTEVVKAHILPSQLHFLNSPSQKKLIFGTLCPKRGLGTLSPARSHVSPPSGVPLPKRQPINFPA